ncbi:hypothetical protein FVR03_00585 [Pontibacter qinzhouensis]|uniref:Uncharacterized protein n=1 Tax=Pontibacter qinzhouensis TaxID=2603253 RepID=A0A5C8KES0_9BACT|nr:hypothetical protein [Pontibacter qinzhouensis]TXK52903.1 hypothetical protein FVR03_00585 [Pontibacter qinzhouensis]
MRQNENRCKAVTAVLPWPATVRMLLSFFFSFSLLLVTTLPASAQPAESDLTLHRTSKGVTGFEAYGFVNTSN